MSTPQFPNVSTNRWRISRRHMLRGVGGVMMGLPFLEVMETQAATSQPNRLACIYMPNGGLPSDWTPAGSGLKLTSTLSPLESLKDDVTGDL